jgi:hypothetical protein
MPKKRSRDTPEKQSQRFVETARALGVDESGKAFERAVKGLLAHKSASTAKPPRKGGR